MRVLLPALALVLFAGCSSAGRTTEVVPVETGPSQAEILDRLSEYEEFDLSPYPNELIETEVVLEHLVPDELMTNQAGSGQGGARRGYRIQLVFAREKATADNSVQEFLEWWRQQQTLRPNDPMFRGDIPVDNIYQQPYYRVRIGEFTSRSSAESFLSMIINDYPRAFVVVDAIGEN